MRRSDEERRAPGAESQERFPFDVQSRALTFREMRVFLKPKAGVAYEGGTDLAMGVARPDSSSLPGISLTPDVFLGLPAAQVFGNDGDESPGLWRVTVAESLLQAVHPALRKQVTIDGQTLWRLAPQAIDDLLVLVTYDADAAS